MLPRRGKRQATRRMSRVPLVGPIAAATAAAPHAHAAMPSGIPTVVSERLVTQAISRAPGSGQITSTTPTHYSVTACRLCCDACATRPSGENHWPSEAGWLVGALDWPASGATSRAPRCGLGLVSSGAKAIRTSCSGGEPRVAGEGSAPIGRGAPVDVGRGLFPETCCRRNAQPGPNRCVMDVT